jgi:hypothetical protein
MEGFLFEAVVSAVAEIVGIHIDEAPRSVAYQLDSVFDGQVHLFEMIAEIRDPVIINNRAIFGQDFGRADAVLDDEQRDVVLIIEIDGKCGDSAVLYRRNP